MNFYIAIIIFALTLAFVIIKPFKLGQAVYAAFFAVAVIAFKLVSFSDIGTVINNVWNAGFSLISIMIISSILDEIGFFKWAALTMALTAEGQGKKLFLYIILLGAMISIFFNNDGTIIILTPIVYEIIKALGFKEKNILPFIFACSFIADAASIPLVVSNLANIINADILGLSFNYYLSKMLIPGLIVIIGITIMLFLYYRKNIVNYYNPRDIGNPDDVITDWGMFNVGVMVLFIVIIGYFIASKHKIPVSLISIIGAVVLLIFGKVKKSLEIKKILKKAPWDILIFAFSMYLIVFGLYKNGFNEILLNLLLKVQNNNRLLIAIYSGFVSTISACTMNNLPSVMLSAFTINDPRFTEISKEIIAFSSIIGNDLGAKLTPIGSLATILWFDILKLKGVEISWFDYIKAAFYVVTPVLVMSLFVLGLMFS